MTAAFASSWASTFKALAKSRRRCDWTSSSSTEIVMPPPPTKRCRPKTRNAPIWRGPCFSETNPDAVPASRHRPLSFGYNGPLPAAIHLIILDRCRVGNQDRRDAGASAGGIPIPRTRLSMLSGLSRDRGSAFTPWNLSAGAPNAGQIGHRGGGADASLSSAHPSGRLSLGHALGAHSLSIVRETTVQC